MAYEKPKVMFSRQQLLDQGYDPDVHPAYEVTVHNRMIEERARIKDEEYATRAARLEAKGISPEARRDGVLVGEVALEGAFDPNSKRPISDQH